ncbi:hypothetical protein [Crocosphaera sp.]|uniref:hypothetical protein n=1 Tax=Crocosphaera sp. TaxID=2729996 RepID=UPI003F1E60A4|nr:hypothetical protein [Crocosphaera sp.]
MLNSVSIKTLFSLTTSGFIALGSILSLGINSAQAFQIFFGEDINNSSFIPLSSFSNATLAESQFLSNLIDVKTEDFESFNSGNNLPLDLTFSGSTGDIKAMLSGGNGTIISIPTGSTNRFGRYAISPTNFFELKAGATNTFQIDFEIQVAAFGFYGIDIGDFGGQLELELVNGTTEKLTVPNTLGNQVNTDGSVLFYGLIAEDVSKQFTKVKFLTTTGRGDVFGFDDFTVGDIKQIKKVSESSSILSLGIFGLIALGLGFKIKFKKR